MKDFLTPDEILALRNAHKQIKEKKVADRIKAILSLNAGFSYEQIAAILLLDDVTLRRYVEKFKVQGVKGLLECRYQGGTSRLSLTQEDEIKKYLRENTAQTAKEAVAYIQKTYAVSYSVVGITKLLHRLGFVYKKPKLLPAKANTVLQGEFLKLYERTKEDLNDKDRIYFLDATHPTHNTRAAYGWILKGKANDKYVKSTSGRKRLNLNGALNFSEKKAIVLEEQTIDAGATIRLFEAIRRDQKHGKVYLILDNAKQHHAKLVKNWIRNHPRFKLLYLPAYSPNLNLIERLWRFFHQKITYNRYFESFNEFKEQSLAFFKNLKQYDAQLASLLTDNFQTLPS